jgi:phospholipase/carboxylesterase
VSPGLLDAVEVEPRAQADAAVVLLHGLGADGHDFEALVQEVRLPAPHTVRWVFPHAPIRAVTLNGGQRMRAWYDITSLDWNGPEDEPGLRESADGVRALVEREKGRGIASDRIVLAGFSQGGALALYAALREPARLAGVVALSSYLPLASRLAQEAHPANAAVSIFMAHGTHDPVVPHVFGEGSRDLLRSHGYDVEWHSYPIPHTVSAEEIGDLRAWLLHSVPARG